MPKYNRAEDIPDSYIKRMGRLRSIVNLLDKRHGQGQWGDPEVVEYILTTDTVKERRAAAGLEALGLVRQRAKDFEQRVAEFVSSFEDVTYNDEVAIRQAVSIEIELETLSDRIRNTGGKMDVADLKELTQLQVKLSAEYRQIQSSLGIDRAKRDTELNAADEIKKFVEGAKKLFAGRLVRIECKNQGCKDSNKKINQGFIMFNFKGQVPFRWWSACPACGGDVVINIEADPSKDWRALVGETTNGKVHTERSGSPED